MRVFISVALVFLLHSVNAQYTSGITYPDQGAPVTSLEDEAYKFATTISSKEIAEHLSVLSSDEYEGRETGRPGNEKAAAYLSAYFEKLGLPQIGDKESYYQPVSFTFTSWTKGILKIGNEKLKLLRDFVAFPQKSYGDSFEANEIIFAGYGIEDKDYSDYIDQDVNGKVVMVFDGEPVDLSGKSLLTGSDQLSTWSTDHQKKSTLAKEKGARLLIIVSNDLKRIIDENRSQILNRITQLGIYTEDELTGVNTVFISPKIAERILGDQRESIIKQRDALVATGQGKIHSKIKTDIIFESKIQRRTLEGNNVLGYIEGESKKDEVIIVSAHYDHVGMKGDEVYNGADDNASGTTALLEIAEAFATAKRLDQGPERSILFILVTGEEKGLLGSEYYAENPIFEISQTVADINVDMIGRRGKEYEKTKQPYIYVIGSDRISQDLHDVNELVNERYSKLLLDYKYNDEKDPNRFYYRSDHYNFAKKGIPSIFFFSGVHSDYHRISDTFDKIDLSLMTKRTQHIFHLTWELANRDERIRSNASNTLP